MEREIKFRAWDKVTRAMYTDQDSKGMWQVPVANNGVIKSSDEIILMQFVGIYDKNSTPVYEGDIYKVANNQEYIVKWIDFCEYGNDTYFATFVLWQSEQVAFPFDQYAVENGIVIGNIHQTPELI